MITFNSLGQCIQFFKDKGIKCNQSSLNKYIKNKKVYKGYIPEYI
jgi:hypothetical protein